jgi:shikimate kinase
MPEKQEVIVLIGPMGVGKTTIGKKLAKILDMPFLDTDQLIVKSHGPIADYFEKNGEQAFRIIEQEALLDAVQSPAVVATGGGAVLAEGSMAVLSNCTVIYLATDGKHMASRLRKSTRPLLKNGLEDWNRIYEARRPIYKQVADYEIDTSGHSLAETISAIRERLAR